MKSRWDLPNLKSLVFTTIFQRFEILQIFTQMLNLESWLRFGEIYWILNLDWMWQTPQLLLHSFSHASYRLPLISLFSLSFFRYHPWFPSDFCDARRSGSSIALPPFNFASWMEFHKPFLSRHHFPHTTLCRLQNFVIRE